MLLLTCDIIIYVTGEGVDYVSGPYPVIFPAGQITAVLSIPIINDSKLEGNENFVVSIYTLSLPDRVFATNPDESTVIIVDDDGK